MKIKPRTSIGLVALLAVAAFTARNASAQTPIAIPASYAMPAGSVNTSQPGFRVRAYQTDATHGGTLAWSEDQLAGIEGPNVADLTYADASGYFNINTSSPVNPTGLVNWNISPGSSVDTFIGADPFPGIPGVGANPTVNFTEEVLTYIQFPTAGTYTMGVNSDDGFGVATSALNPKDRFSAIEVGQYNSTRGSGDTLFQVSVTQAGIYPFRLVYFQVGGGANLAWFSVITNSTSTNYVLLNDTSTPGALMAYPTANIAPPYTGSFNHSPAGFTFTISDDLTALDPNSLQVQLNGANVTVSTSKTGSVTTVSYTAPVLFSPGVTNTVTIQYADNAQPAHQGSAAFSFAEAGYTVLPPAAALPSSAVDTAQPGFLYRVSQIDSTTYNVLAANVAHAEAQLAGLLTDPVSGSPYPNIATAGTQPDGSYIINGTINFSFDLTAEQGAFTSVNNYPDAAFPGITGQNSDNMAGEIIGYLDLKAGFYTFAVNATDGFRLTAAANPYDALGTTLGLFDYRATATTETQFGVAVQQAGIYPVRLLWYRMTGGSAAGLEFYTINADGTKTLVNDSSSPNAVKAYWKRTAGYGTFVKYAGPSAFASPFLDSSDVGFTNVVVKLSDGTTNQVKASSVTLAVDGTTISNATVNAAGGITTVSYIPSGLQLPRMVHAAVLSYQDQDGTSHTDAWNFHLLRNYVLPSPLYYEDFESTAAGPNPTVPTGWVEENHTDSQTAGIDPTDLNSDFYLGWVVVDKSFNITKDFGVSAYTPQVLNGVAFSEDTNPLLVNHYIRAESDVRGGSQIQYLTTKSYDLTGKTGIVVAFDSAYEQNQDNVNSLEYTVDGTNWNPILYWMQGDFDGGGPSDIIRDGVGNVDAYATMMTSHGDAAHYTDPNTGQVIGYNYGAFIKAPITPALAPYIEGRFNDDSTESKRIEVYRVPLADNQKSVQFRFMQAGTGSWYWAVDNWGVYSVPSIVVTPPTPGTLSIALQGGNAVITWTGSGALQSAATVTGPWTNVSSAASPYTVTPTTGGAAFYRLSQ